MREPILIRPDTHGRAIWWIDGFPKPDPDEIDRREARFNALLNKRARSIKRYEFFSSRSVEGWTENGVLIIKK